MDLLVLLLILLAIFAFAGGILVHPLIFLVLIVVVVAFLVPRGRW